jgi:site-specific DNA-methyltransferase (cytosine-N4-specific)
LACKVEIYNPEFRSLKDIDWNFPENQHDAISQIHPYPARFIESLPRNLIQSLGCAENTVIFDPFCGSGTTLLEAQRAGIPSIGVDLNPIACLISRVKTQPLDSAFEEHFHKVIADSARALKNGIEIPKIPNLNHWFAGDVQKAIAALVVSIDGILSAATKDALRLCLSSIIVRVSKQDSDTRYAAVENTSTAGDVFSGFRTACEKLLSAKQTANYSVDSRVITGDILSVTPDDITAQVGLVITSPPYPNAYEYWLYHKYRMWWLGYDPIDVREKEIGARPHYQKKNGQTEEDFSSQMSGVFSLFNKCIIRGGLVCIVIGRSIIKGRHIDNAGIIKKVALECNYELVADIEREIQLSRKSFNLSYGKITTENILVFRKG